MSDIYFVLNGLVNGERGASALPAGGGGESVQADGWYYLLPGDADGRGPYSSRDEAAEALRGETAWYILYHELDERAPSFDRVPEGGPDADGEGEALISVRWDAGSGSGSGDPGHWILTMEGSYERLRLEVSVEKIEDALRAFGAAYGAVEDLFG